MRIFVTGATGFVGSAVVRELIDAGHQVTGLVRSDTSAADLAATGADVVRGSLDDLSGLRDVASRSDGVVHTAFDHDFSRFAANCERDRLAIEALAEGLGASARPLVVTSGLAHFEPGQAVVETDAARPPTASMPRASEATALALAARGVCASVVRLPPSVHGQGDHGFVPHLIGVARRTGVSAQVGEGGNRWPAVHRLDAAGVFRGAVEQAVRGARYHAVAEEGVLFRDLAALIARQLGLPVKRLTPAEARTHFGWFAGFAQLDVTASSAVTQARLGWAPRDAGLLADVAASGYFAVPDAG